jgi:hypothetical protein
MLGAIINRPCELGLVIQRVFDMAFVLKQVYNSVLQGDGGPKVLSEAID